MFEGSLQLLVLQPQAHLFFRIHFLPFHSNISRTFLCPRFVGTQSKLELQLHDHGYSPKSLRHHEPGCNGLEVVGLACLGMHWFKIQLQGFSVVVGMKHLQSSWMTGTIITHSYLCFHTPGMLKAASTFSWHWYCYKLS
ncbi:hypothetical protein L195_g005390 [Trifolium pratense]|uniref:Uncharacterized protein n=1 Tax=Trifolium pratense TaxID=57577 RepID=A0A2K3P0T7_TRIPR|nr:hypothetical protein L195_g005390 [Trifolium pratense]